MNALDSIQERLDEIEARKAEIKPEVLRFAAVDGDLEGADAERWKAIEAELAGFDTEEAELNERKANFEARAKAAEKLSGINFNTDTTRDNPFDLEARAISNMTVGEVRSRAQKCLERSTGWAADEHRDAVSKLVERGGSIGAEAARLTIVAGSDEYRTAWAKAMSGSPLTPQDSEQLSRAMTSGTGSTGGYVVPIQIDPTLIITGSGSTNPFRAISRVRQSSVPTYSGATVGQITAAYTAESGVFGDNTPTLAAVTIPTYKVGAFVPATFEAFDDIDALASDVAELFADAKDNFEAGEFATGSGSSAIQGVVTGVTAITASRVSPATGGAFAVADVYSLHKALPPRHRVSASATNRSWVGNVGVIDLMRQFGTANNYHAFLTDLAGGQPPRLLGDQLNESSAMSSSITTGQNTLLFGDFSRYYIVDRIGATTEFIPNLFDTSTGRPTGQRAWLMHWRVGGGVADPNAFRILKL